MENEQHMLRLLEAVTRQRNESQNLAASLTATLEMTRDDLARAEQTIKALRAEEHVPEDRTCG
jgi:hypothetical protein